jgi:hypothetical protein
LWLGLRPIFSESSNAWARVLNRSVMALAPIGGGWAGTGRRQINRLAMLHDSGVTATGNRPFTLAL